MSPSLVDVFICLWARHPGPHRLLPGRHQLHAVHPALSCNAIWTSHLHPGPARPQRICFRVRCSPWHLRCVLFSQGPKARARRRKHNQERGEQHSGMGTCDDLGGHGSPSVLDWFVFLICAANGTGSQSNHDPEACYGQFTTLCLDHLTAEFLLE